MRDETWKELDEALADALELPAATREDFLRERLRGKSEALEQALRLVKQSADAEKLFSKGPLASWSEVGAGYRLGPWDLVRPLGSGGMGTVWLARRADGHTEMRVAIKMLPPALSGPIREDSELQQRFRMEKQILARLQHPNIARLLDAGAGAGETPNFVMEFVEGAPLMEYVKRESVDPLPLFLKICEAVQYAHANLVIHRDLKPQNILVDQNGEPKLLDFGIAKILNDPAGDSSVTLRRAFSLDYASPEQIRGGPISTATDIYSLGLLLYEMCSGKRARQWNDKALGEVLNELDRFALPDAAELGADLAAILAKATADEAAKRYAGVGELAADIVRLREGLPVEARPLGPLYLVSRLARRNLLAVSGLALGLALVAGLAAWGWSSARQAEERSQQLEAAFSAEKAARKEEEAERAKARQQEKLAQELGKLAELRSQLAEERMGELVRVFDSLIRSAREDIAKLPGGTSTSIQLLEKLVTQFASLAPTEATRKNFLLLRADAHGQLAELYGGNNSSLGDRAQAKRHRSTSIELWEQLNRLAPGFPDWERGLLDARFRLALLDKEQLQADSSAGWKLYEAGYGALLKRYPRDPLLQVSVGNFHFFRALTLPQGSDLRKMDFEAAMRFYSESATRSGASAETKRNQALVHKYYANTPGLAGEERLRHAQEALRLDRARVAESSKDANARLDLGFSLTTLADVQAGLKDYASACKGYRESFELRKSIALVDVNNVFVRRSLFYPAQAYAWCSWQISAYQELALAVKDVDWALEQSPRKLQASEKASLHLWKGAVAGKTGDRAGACRELLAASQLEEGLAAETRQSLREQLDLHAKNCRVEEK